MMQAYSLSPAEKVSPTGLSDVEEEGGREEEEEIGAEDEGGEAVDVMMERRETVDEGVV